jgi:hypothetical protein
MFFLHFVGDAGGGKPYKLGKLDLDQITKSCDRFPYAASGELGVSIVEDNNGHPENSDDCCGAARRRHVASDGSVWRLVWVRLRGSSTGSVRVRTRVLGWLRVWVVIEPSLAEANLRPGFFDSTLLAHVPIKRPCRCVSVPAPGWA